MKLRLVLMLMGVSLGAQAIETGQTLEPFTLQDQFEETVTLTESTRILLVASSRKAASVVDEAIKEQPEGYLEARKALYVADISKMPGLVTRMFLIPSMREANYRVLLDRESAVAPEHLKNDGEVLWLRLDNREVLERRTFTDAEELRAALEEESS